VTDADVGRVEAAAGAVHRQHGCSGAFSCRTCIWLPSVGEEGTAGCWVPYRPHILAFDHLLLIRVPGQWPAFVVL
jgi:hypothetical protein